MGECLCIAVIDRFSVALFSAREQTHCVCVACDSERVTVAFLIARIFDIHKSGVPTALFARYA